LLIDCLFLLIELQVTFEYDTSEVQWSASVVDLEVKDQMVYFKTPSFPYSITELTPVKIIFRQRKRILEPLEFSYLPICNLKYYFYFIFRNFLLFL